jgi:hypothetical protein
MELNIENNNLSHNSRTRAFDFLKDKDIIAKRLEKTKLCKNIITNGMCNRKFCSYAHSLKDLKEPKCVFDKNCRKPQCQFKHSIESKEDYYKRCSSRDKTVSKKRLLQPVEDNVFLNNEQHPIDLSEMLLIEASQPTKQNKVENQQNENNLTIKIEKNCVEDAVKSAINNGIKNIHIIIV